MTSVTLYSDGFWISPYVFTCFVALREKGVPFDVKEVRLQAGEQQALEYRERSWSGRVPAIAHGDFWLTESSAIVEYLEETFAPPAHAALLPVDVKARARARQLMSWLRSDETVPVRAERSAEVIFYELPRAPLTPRGASCAAKVVTLASRFVQGGRGPMFGEWSIVDAELAFFLHRLWADEGVVPDALRDYAEAQWKRASVAEYVAHARAPFVSYG